MSNQNNDNELQEMTDIQGAYDLTFDLFMMSKQGNKRAMLTEVFGIAAMFTPLVVPVSPVVGACLLGAAYIYGAVQRRETSMKMAQHFNEVASNLGGHAKNYLGELERGFKDVQDFSFDDINPVKHYEKKNFLGLAFGAFSILLSPTLLPVALNVLATQSDKILGLKTQVNAFKAGDQINNDYGDKLVQPMGPQ